MLEKQTNKVLRHEPLLAKFIKLVMEEANAQGKVFFYQFVDGHNEYETDWICAVDTWGFLVPFEKAEEFMDVYMKHERGEIRRIPEYWREYRRCAEWELVGEREFKITFID